jgi:hypothetical protein
LREGDRGFGRPSGLISPFEVASDAAVPTNRYETPMATEPDAAHGTDQGCSGRRISDVREATAMNAASKPTQARLFGRPPAGLQRTWSCCRADRVARFMTTSRPEATISSLVETDGVYLDSADARLAARSNSRPHVTQWEDDCVTRSLMLRDIVTITDRPCAGQARGRKPQYGAGAARAAPAQFLTRQLRNKLRRSAR